MMIAFAIRFHATCHADIFFDAADIIAALLIFHYHFADDFAITPRHFAISAAITSADATPCR
jgi:hypothetical protein